MFRRQKFSKAGFVKTITKEAAKKKAAEKIKKIDKLDMDRLTTSFSKMKKILADLPENKKAKNIYDSSIKSIKSRITKGKSKEDKRDAMKAYERYAQTIFKGSIFNLKNYVSTDDMNIHNWFDKASELALTPWQKDRLPDFKISLRKREAEIIG